MENSNIQTYQSRIKAAHRYEVVEAGSRLNIAGKRFHFIGAGGVGISGLAKLLLKNKAIITGSDQTPGDIADKLCRAGADIKIGHSPDNLGPRSEERRVGKEGKSRWARDP